MDVHVGDEINEGDIHLVGGRYLWEGRVEIFMYGVWGTVSDDGAGTNDAAVVCRQLGYTAYRKIESVVWHNQCTVA